MADKKINQLDDASSLSVNDLFVVNQDQSSGKALKVSGGKLKDFILGGTTIGVRVFFTVGAPSSALGVNDDIVFDTQLHRIYQKVSGLWMLKDNYAAIGGMGQLKFTVVYDTNGLSADGMVYKDTDLIGTVVQEVRVEADALIPVNEFGDTPAFDEWDFDIPTGTITFGSPLPINTRITILYSV